MLVLMNQFTRRLVGFGVPCGAVTGADLCGMFNAATVCHVRRLVGIWSKFQEFDRRPIIQDERDPHPG